jgi:hypothetical protein
MFFRAAKLLSINTFVFLVFYGLLELTFYFINIPHRKNGDLPPNPIAKMINGDLFSKKNSLPPWLPSKSWESMGIKYTIDQRHRRATPFAGREGEEKIKFVIFGCSYAYGVGVENDETIPFFLQETAKFARSYNYGIPGAGPNQNLYLLENHPELFSDVSGKTIGIYLYFSDHINRTALNFSHNMWSNLELPEYRIENHRLVGGEMLHISNPIKYYLYRLLQISEVSRYFLLVHDRSNRAQLTNWDENDTLLTSQVLKRLQDRFLEKYKNASFIVYSISSDPRETEIFRKNGINFFPRSAMRRELDKLSDGHLTASSNKIVANEILEILHSKLPTKID